MTIPTFLNPKSKDIFDVAKRKEMIKQRKKFAVNTNRVLDLGIVYPGMSTTLFFDRNGMLYDMYPKAPEILNMHRGQTCMCVSDIAHELYEQGYDIPNSIIEEAEAFNELR